MGRGFLRGWWEKNTDILDSDGIKITNYPLYMVKITYIPLRNNYRPNRALGRGVKLSSWRATALQSLAPTLIKHLIQLIKSFRLLEQGWN